MFCDFVFYDSAKINSVHSRGCRLFGENRVRIEPSVELSCNNNTQHKIKTVEYFGCCFVWFLCFYIVEVVKCGARGKRVLVRCVLETEWRNSKRAKRHYLVDGSVWFSSSERCDDGPRRANIFGTRVLFCWCCCGAALVHSSLVECCSTHSRYYVIRRIAIKVCVCVVRRIHTQNIVRKIRGTRQDVYIYMRKTRTINTHYGRTTSDTQPNSLSARRQLTERSSWAVAKPEPDSQTHKEKCTNTMTAHVYKPVCSMNKAYTHQQAFTHHYVRTFIYDT